MIDEKFLSQIPQNWREDGVLEHLNVFQREVQYKTGRAIDSKRKVSSSDRGYQIGDLSIYPENLDTYSTLFATINNGVTNLVGPLGFSGDIISVADASKFPESGLIVIDQEVIFYNRRTSKSFSDLKRGFAGQRSPHNPGSIVKAGVCADHHNALRDAIWNIQRHWGLEDDFNDETIFGLLNKLEQRFIPLSPVFSTVRRIMPSGSLFSFKDRSVGTPVSWSWDFGDGGTSRERNPHHRYFEGENGETEFTVTLTCRDAQGNISSIKRKNYIQLAPDSILIHANPQKAYLAPGGVAVRFSDQSLGHSGIKTWSFGDGNSYTAKNRYENSIEHIYQNKGVYEVYLTVETAEIYEKYGVARSNTEPLIVEIL